MLALALTASAVRAQDPSIYRNPTTLTPQSAPLTVDNPFVQSPATTQPTSPAAEPSPVGIRYSDAAQPIDNPYFGESEVAHTDVSTEPAPWVRPTIANPFAEHDATWTLANPLRWGPTSRWQIAPPPAAGTEVDGPVLEAPARQTPGPAARVTQLRPLDAPPQLQPTTEEIDEPIFPGEGRLELPEAIAAEGEVEQLPDPTDWSGIQVAQPTWLDVVDHTEPIESHEPTELVAEQTDESNGDGYDGTYDPFEETEASPVAETEPQEFRPKSPATKADEWQPSALPLEPPAELAVEASPLADSELNYIAQQGAYLPNPSDSERTEGDTNGNRPAAGPIDLQFEPLPEDAHMLLTEARTRATIANTRDELSEVIRLARYTLTKDTNAEQIRAARQLAAWAHNRRGELLDEAGDPQAALDDYHAAVTLDGQCWLALHNRAIAMAERHEYDQSLHDFAATIALNPGLTAAYRNRGELLASLGRSQEASEDYTMAISQQPAVAELYVLRGDTWHRLEDFKRAVNDFTRAIQLDPGNAQAYTSRGNLLAEVGLYEQALANFTQALRADATYVDAHRSQAWLLATCPDEFYRDGTKALAAARQAARFATPNDPFVLESLAAACAAIGNFDHAVEFQRRAVAVAATENAQTLRYRLALYEQQQPFVSGEPRNVQAASFEE